ncbi:hypothetical protein [Devosia sp.]|uniref:hypothetical protein n=1 Tax=Devosia sp. TaxID=1871048 RepID=UPI001B2D091D|nr:hypothetical protein [Devosia sp.]MBO9587859.1 hypothetical protein [Devosia sp.]
MGVSVESNVRGSCCLCGANAVVLTGEHKVKASALKKEFGNRPLYIGNVEHGPMRYAQGTKSKAFHFNSKLCADCNSSRTQGADRAFDKFNSNATQLCAEGAPPEFAFMDEAFLEGTPGYVDLFRYFAKILCCHIADLDGPRLLHMCNFAIGKNNQNCVYLSVDLDPKYKKYVHSGSYGPYAAHGGLVVYSDGETGGPNAFHSTLTIGPVRYVFYSRLTWLERLEVRLGHMKFYDWCRQMSAEAKRNPISSEDRLDLGLNSGDDA